MISSIVYYLTVQSHGGAPHQHYGKWYYTIYVSSIMILLLPSNILNPNVKRIVEKVSGTTFTIYMAHLPLLLYLTGLRPIQNTAEAVVTVIVMFAGLSLLSQVLRKLPILRLMA